MNAAAVTTDLDDAPSQEEFAVISYHYGTELKIDTDPPLPEEKSTQHTEDAGRNNNASLTLMIDLGIVQDDDMLDNLQFSLNIRDDNDSNMIMRNKLLKQWQVIYQQISSHLSIYVNDGWEKMYSLYYCHPDESELELIEIKNNDDHDDENSVDNDQDFTYKTNIVRSYQDLYHWVVYCIQQGVTVVNLQLQVNCFKLIFMFVTLSN